jgi:flavodoxin
MIQLANVTPEPNTRREFFDFSLKAMFSLAFASTLLASTRALPQPGKKAPVRKALVLYQSRTGNTRTVARLINEAIGSDLVEIRPMQPYPEDYDAVVAQNAKEQRTNYLPPLSTTIENIRDYDVVLIGSPIWNVRLTPPVRSFLSRHNLSGKTIAPFVTYKVSGLGRARRDIQDLCPRSTILEGLAVPGDEAPGAKPAVSRWLARIGLPAIPAYQEKSS